MFRECDLKRAIWIAILIGIFFATTITYAQIPQEAEIHNRLGNEYCDNGEFLKCVQEYQEAIKAYPEYVDAYYNLGVTFYHDLKDYQNAANYFQKFLEFESETSDAQQIQKWLTTIEREHGIKPQPIPVEKKEEPKAPIATAPPPAVPIPPSPQEPPKVVPPSAPTPSEPPLTEIPTKAVVIPPVPVTPPAPSLPGMPSPQKKTTGPPIEEKDISEERHKMALIHKNRGNLYSQQGKHQMAVREYSKAVELRPDYSDALYNLGKTYDFDLNDNEKAILYYEEFLKYEPSNSRDARQVQTWLTRARMDLDSSKKAPSKPVAEKEVTEKPTIDAKYESEPFTKGLLEKPIQVASKIPQKPYAPDIPKAVTPPAPVVIPAPSLPVTPEAPEEDSTLLKSFIPKDLKSIQHSIMIRAEMRKELLDIFRSKHALQPEKLAQLFLTKIKQESMPDGDEVANIEIPGDLLSNINKVHILTHVDRIRLNNEKGQLLRSPQTPETKKRLQEINLILENGYEIRP